MMLYSRSVLLLSTIFVVAAESQPAVETTARIRRAKSSKSSKSSIKSSVIDIDVPYGPPHIYEGGSHALEALRFNKLPFMSEDNERTSRTDMFPLVSDDYPLTEDTANILKTETMADSVVVESDFQLYGSELSIDYWLDDERIQPVYPGEDAFWDEMRLVTEVQIARRNGEDPSTLSRWPDIWAAKTTLYDVARAVQGEYPALHQQTVIEKLYKGGLEMYRDMGPFRSMNDFIGKQVLLATINTWSFEAVAPINFMMKWHLGMPRPEEVAWLISNDAIEEDVPEDLVDLIKSMELKNPYEFTAYPNGSPFHPAFPAMHSAGSTVSFWLPSIANVTPEQYCELLRVDYATAYARTVAGVHYAMDNMAGLNLGQRIIHHKLPIFLETMYGYNAATIDEKLSNLTFDWNTFDPNACTIDGVSTSDFLANARRL